MFVKVKREILSDLVQYVRLLAEPHPTDTICMAAIKVANQALKFLQDETTAEAVSELDDTRRVMADLIDSLQRMTNDQLRRFEEVKEKCLRLKKDLRKKGSKDIEQVVLWANGAKDVDSDYGRAARHVLEMLDRARNV